jgi:hypothetical protein
MPTPPNEHPRLWFLGPRAEPPEGITVVRVHLPAFFVIVRRVGRDSGLLLLTLRALRQRASVETLRLSDLAWMLWTTRGQVLGWLDRLSQARLVVYETRADLDPVVVEFVRDPPDPSTWPVDGTIVPGPPQELPTHWFVQVLPRVGRTSFLVYLYLLSREGAPQAPSGVVVERVAAALKLRGPLTVHYHLGRLQRFGLARRTRSGRSLIVLDPPPLTRWGRFRLQLLRWGFLPLPWRKILLASLLVALALLILGFLVTHPLHGLPPAPVPDSQLAHPVRLAGVLPRA